MWPLDMHGPTWDTRTFHTGAVVSASLTSDFQETVSEWLSSPAGCQPVDGLPLGLVPSAMAGVGRDLDVTGLPL